MNCLSLVTAINILMTLLLRMYFTGCFVCDICFHDAFLAFVGGIVQDPEILAPLIIQRLISIFPVSVREGVEIWVWDRPANGEPVGAAFISCSRRLEQRYCGNNLKDDPVSVMSRWYRAGHISVRLWYLFSVVI